MTGHSKPQAASERQRTMLCPLTYRSLHVLAIVLFCLAGAHVAQAQILPLLHALAAALSPLH